MPSWATSFVHATGGHPGQYASAIALGISSSIVPARVAQRRIRWPLRWLTGSAALAVAGAAEGLGLGVHQVGGHPLGHGAGQCGWRPSGPR